MLINLRQKFTLDTINRPLEHNDNHFIPFIKKGDKTAFDTVYLNYFKRLHQYATNFIKNHDDAEEIIQNVFCRIWEKRAQLDTGGYLKSFLYRSVHNECLNYLKHQNVRSTFKVYHNQTAVNEQDLSKELLAVELQKQIHMAINELPTQCRTIFQMSRIEQLKYNQIAEKLNLSVKTVENQMGKALKMLRLKLVDFLPLILIYLTQSL